MPAFAKMDETGKVTVSLGGSCKLRCAHCYITAPRFVFNPKLRVDDVIAAVRGIDAAYDTICISGDTDPLLREDDFLHLIRRLNQEIQPRNLMFTTRLIPSGRIFDGLIQLGSDMSGQKRLLVPCASFVTSSYPNQIENHRLVPPPTDRADLLARFLRAGLPTFAALRPTFPFNIVPPSEIDLLIQMIRKAATCVLGEVFLLDEDGVIASRLGLDQTTEPAANGYLTFLDQPAGWQKRHFAAEVRYVSNTAKVAGLPFFLRSMSAIRYLEKAWDFNVKKIVRGVDSCVNRPYDDLMP